MQLWAGLLQLACTLLPGQTVRIYSEFQRIDPFGAVVPADKAERPREILSPALVRNGYASFRVAVTLPEDKSYSLHFGQNPTGTVKVTVYKELYTKTGGSWIPDRLELIDLPYDSANDLPDTTIPGQTTETFWLDLWVPPDAPVGRLRLEAQLEDGGRWFIYPMELRILQATVPAYTAPPDGLKPLGAAADGHASAELAAYLCGVSEKVQIPATSLRRLAQRNARQDIALAHSIEAKKGKDAVASAVVNAAAAHNLSSWCASPSHTKSFGAEWYLRVRDFFYRTATNLANGDVDP